MRFGSVCSGIEAASVAWNPLGWEAAWLSEIEPFPSAVLAHHYPDVPNLGDMTALPERILSGEVEAPDLFCGGTPCQGFSVAGLRQSLDDARGNLSLVFCEIANAIDSVRSAGGKPASIIFWENVPGVLSTKDNAFGCFLAGLAGEDEPLEPPGGKWANAGYVSGPKRTVAWRILDAQYFGVAQRRRRVFVVASARDDFDPAAVLFEFDGVRRDIAPSRQTGQEVTPTIRAGAPNGGPGHGARSGDSKDELIVPVLSQCITTGTGQRYDPETETILPVATFSCGGIGAYTEDTAAATLLKSGQDLGNGCEALISQPMVVHGTQDPCVSNGMVFALGRNNGGENAVMQPTAFGGDIVRTLQARHDSSPCADRGMNVVAQPIAFVQNSRDEVRLMGGDGSHVGALAAETGAKQQCYVAQPIAFPPTQDPISSTDGTTHGLGCGSSGGQASVAVAFQTDQSPEASTELAYTLTTPSPSGGGQPQSVFTAMAVRRLTPVECERLQGFPDNYTAIPWRKKPASECPDGPRYKALGNSWAVPVVCWIGKRIAAHLEAA